LVKKVGRFTNAFENIADNLYWYLLRLAINVSAVLFVLYWKKPILGAVMTVWIIVFMAVNWVLTNYKFKYDMERSEAETKSSAILADTITNQSNVKLFNGYDRELNRFDRALDVVRRLRTFTWDLDTIFDGVQTMLTVGLEILIFYVAIGLWQDGILTIGDFALLQSYLLTIFEQVWNFGKTMRHMYERMAEANEMTEILMTPHEVQDISHAPLLAVGNGLIEFKNVSFCYHQTRKVVSKFSLAITPGEKIAFVGPSGAGKSTIVKLILRQHDLTSGTILIDGQNVAKVTQESLWKAASYVPQEPILFHRTLLENIGYGKPDARKEEIVAAAKLAHCHEFISEFPNGYDTYVGERGVKLSGGERQRVAIARAILRNAPILILDEATSSLDSESEHLIQDALDALMKGKTVIVIAHRLSTIMKMDRIIVMNEGRIVEEGTHAELIKKRNGLYKKLWNIQVGGFIGA
ncbi:MAG: ABC transporter ATP-binding protein, partial [Patescibacteria group bacterium]